MEADRMGATSQRLFQAMSEQSKENPWDEPGVSPWGDTPTLSKENLSGGLGVGLPSADPIGGNRLASDMPPTAQQSKENKSIAEIAKRYAADDRLWTTQETVESNLTRACEEAVRVVSRKCFDLTEEIAELRSQEAYRRCPSCGKEYRMAEVEKLERDVAANGVRIIELEDCLSVSCGNNDRLRRQLEQLERDLVVEREKFKNQVIADTELVGQLRQQVEQAEKDKEWLNEFVVKPDYFPAYGDSQWWDERRDAAMKK